MRKKNRGFTLIELVCVILLLGLLAAVGLPKFVDVGTQARMTALDTLVGALSSAATQAHGLCMVSRASTGCNVGSGNWAGTINGKAYQLSVGWPDAGDNLNNNQIDSLIRYSGFQATTPAWDRTKFALQSAPDPANCSVTYIQADAFGSLDYQIITTSSGC